MASGRVICVSLRKRSLDGSVRTSANLRQGADEADPARHSLLAGVAPVVAGTMGQSGTSEAPMGGDTRADEGPWWHYEAMALTWLPGRSVASVREALRQHAPELSSEDVELRPWIEQNDSKWW